MPILPPPESLALSQQVAQMVVVRTTGHLFDHQRKYPAWEADGASLSHYIEDLGVGGVILLGGSAAEVGLRSQCLQAQATVPLLIAADIEEGVGQRFEGATSFPPPMALEAIFRKEPDKALHYAQAMGATTAQEAISIGLNWLLAPVADVNNNPRNPVINVRAFGQSVDVVEPLVASFIRGAQQYSVLTTAKHFPGHGDTDIDSHLRLPVLSHTLERLNQLEFQPFRAAIAAGVDAVMTAHLKAPVLDAQHPATLSTAILTDRLRGQLGFDGLIVTDALMMGAITQTYGPYEAAVLAAEAGADVLLMPADPEGVIHAICEAVAIGRLPKERILASVERIWRAKQKVTALMEVPPESCHAWEHLPPPPVRLDQLAQPKSRELAAALLKDSNEVRGQLPAPPPEAETVIILDTVVGNRFLAPNRGAMALPQQQGYRLRLVDSQGCRQLPPDPMGPTLLQLFIRGNPFRNSADVTAVAQKWFQALMAAKQLLGLVIFGCPYAFEEFRNQLPPDIPYGFAYGQMPEAQTLLLQTLLAQTNQPRTQGAQAFTD